MGISIYPLLIELWGDRQVRTICYHPVEPVNTSPSGLPEGVMPSGMCHFGDSHKSWGARRAQAPFLETQATWVAVVGECEHGIQGPPHCLESIVVV